MKFPQAQQQARPAAPKVTPEPPTSHHMVLWSTERRQGERGPQWRSTITVIGADGATVSREASDWRSRRHWLLDWALQARTWKKWHVGDVAAQVFKK